MPIHRISLKNFKCFKETDIELSRITVLTGENSSGKSSLIYGILAPFQSNKFPLYLSPNGKYLNMGSFIEMSFKNMKSNEIEINIILDEHGCSNIYKSTWILNPINQMPKLNYLMCIEEDDYSMEIMMSDDNSYIANSDGGNDKPKTIKSQNLENVVKHYLGYFVEDFLEDLNFIGPFRLAPERTYYQKAKADEKVGMNGEGYIDQILEWEHQKAPQFKKLISILKKLELINSLKTQQLKGGRFEVNVRTKSKGVWASLADVGFGISQFLPVIVADLQLSDDSTLILAQPEIHLHPSIQASLADYFVNQIKETGKQYIIETHSEYLLNRFRLDIVKGKLDPADISVYYFEPSPDGSITYRIEFTKDGQIKNAPKGFFDTYMIDAMDIALYA